MNAKINNKLKVERIKRYVDRFINHVKKNPTKIYYVTPIGCGLAGHHVRDIAPLFQDCIDLKKRLFTKSFLENFN
jgi:hypothetical protein